MTSGQAGIVPLVPRAIHHYHPPILASCFDAILPTTLAAVGPILRSRVASKPPPSKHRQKRVRTPKTPNSFQNDPHKLQKLFPCSSQDDCKAFENDAKFAPKINKSSQIFRVTLPPKMNPAWLPESIYFHTIQGAME